MAALEKIGDARAVEPLINALLGDEDRQIRESVAVALGDIGDTRAVEPLINALGDEKWRHVRGAVAGALGSIGDARAIGPLIEALSDDMEDVREAAKKALRRLGHEVE